jgi:hypothetical protein
VETMLERRSRVMTNDIAARAHRNETRQLSLMSKLQVNYGTSDLLSWPNPRIGYSQIQCRRLCRRGFWASVFLMCERLIDNPHHAHPGGPRALAPRLI